MQTSGSLTCINARLWRTRVLVQEVPLSITILPLRYSKRELAHAPEPERQLHLAAGQLLNDFHFLGRLTIIAMAQADHSTPSGRASVGMSFMLLRQLAGRAYEAGLLLKHIPFRAILRDYAGQLSPRARAALEELEPYFAGKNLLARIRNKTSAHLDLDIFNSGFEELPENEELADYHGNQAGNVYFHSAAMVGILSLKRLVGAATYMEALQRANHESLRIIKLLDDLLGGWIAVFSERWLPEHLAVMHEEKQVIVDPPSIQAARIPMFTRA